MILARVAMVALAALLAWWPVAAADAASSTRTDDLPEVITNEVLEARYGKNAIPFGVSGSLSVELPPSTDAPLAVATGKVDPAERARRLAEARREVVRLEAEVADLERRRLAVRNPLLPRPVIPEQLRDQWESMDAVERDARTAEDLERARRALAEARAVEAALAREP